MTEITKVTLTNLSEVLSSDTDHIIDPTDTYLMINELHNSLSTLSTHVVSQAKSISELQIIVLDQANKIRELLNEPEVSTDDLINSAPELLNRLEINTNTTVLV